VLIGGAVLVLLGIWRVTSSFLGAPVPVDTAVRRDVVETLVINGRVLAPSKAGLGAQITGTVESVAVEEGARVSEGQLLVQLDDSEERSAVEKARADMRQAEARLRELRQVRGKTALEDLQQARLVLEEAERKLARLQALKESLLVPAADLEDAARSADVARSRVASARLTAGSVAEGGAESQVTEAGLASARSSLGSAEIRLGKTRIEAPAAGFIVTRTVEPGDVVQPGKVLLTMVLQRETLVLAQPDEKNLRSLIPGQPARASADAFPDRPFPVEVFYVAPAIDLARGTVDVKMRVPRPPDFLRPDMTLSVEIEAGKKSGALVVPTGSVRDLGKDPWVFVIREGHARRQNVKVGLRGGGFVEVLEGLSEGEGVVRPSKTLVREGDRVRKGKG
jgi:HlyD family secretion protein